MEQPEINPEGTSQSDVKTQPDVAAKPEIKPQPEVKTQPDGTAPSEIKPQSDVTPKPEIKPQSAVIESCDSTKSIVILLVEDNPGDVRLTQEVFKDGKICNNLFIVGDGEEAMEFLKKTGKYKDAPRPEIILLDLNLPKKDGRQVLTEIKIDPDLKLIPVIVLTTSAAEQDILNMYANHANAYITKPVDFDQFINVVRSIENFWLSIVKFPPLKK